MQNLTGNYLSSTLPDALRLKHNCLEPDGPLSLSELYAFQALYEQEAGS
jgi:hypothetical protein